MATIFWLLMGHNFGCMIASDTLFDSWGAFYILDAHWRHLANTTETPVTPCAAAMRRCQITSTICYTMLLITVNS